MVAGVPAWPAPAKITSVALVAAQCGQQAAAWMYCDPGVPARAGSDISRGEVDDV